MSDPLGDIEPKLIGAGDKSSLAFVYYLGLFQDSHTGFVGVVFQCFKNKITSRFHPVSSRSFHLLHNLSRRLFSQHDVAITSSKTKENRGTG